jgi:uncharacterized membrane protein
MGESRRADVTAVVLGAFWLLMGVWHFTMHDETMRQMPPYWPWKAFFVAVTGALEILAAIALMPRPTRPWGALATMILLVAYTPAVVHIVQHDVAPLTWPPWARATFRWGVVPANVALFLRARRYWVSSRTRRP